MHIEFWSENLKRRDHVEDVSVEGKDNIRMDHGEIRRKGVEWMHLAQYSDQW